MSCQCGAFRDGMCPLIGSLVSESCVLLRAVAFLIS